MDDAWTSNMRIAQRNRAIPHSTPRHTAIRCCPLRDYDQQAIKGWRWLTNRVLCWRVYEVSKRLPQWLVDNDVNCFVQYYYSHSRASSVAILRYSWRYVFGDVSYKLKHKWKYVGNLEMYTNTQMSTVLLTISTFVIIYLDDRSIHSL